MNNRANLHKPMHRQQGAIAVISMIMLLLLTIIGTGVLVNVTVDEKMVGNLRDKQIADEDAESAVRNGEAWISELNWDTDIDRRTITNLINAPVESPTNRSIWNNNLSDYLLEESAVPWPLQLELWWEKYANKTASLHDGGASWDPHYIIEQELQIRDSARHATYSRGNYKGGQYYYKVTARGNGFSTGRATVQSTFAKRYD